MYKTQQKIFVTHCLAMDLLHVSPSNVRKDKQDNTEDTETFYTQTISLKFN